MPPTVTAPSTHTTDQVNHLNSVLMVGSCVAAYIAPIELFLFSYAVLGPLHYLTEISWLHDRRYFTKHRWDGALLAGLCALVTVLKLAGVGTPELFASVTCVALGGAIVLALVANPIARALLLAVVIGLATVSSPAMSSRIFFGTLVPTIVHVLLFTAAFVLLGALRNRSRSGIASLAVFGLCIASFFLYAPAGPPAPLTDYVINAYRSFASLNVVLIGMLGYGEASGPAQVLRSDAGLRVMRLIAFAYTYHYLNWFSKTSVIRWHEVPRARFAAVLALWVVSLAVYAWDYRTGMLVLFFLSLAHVYLEFPLDAQAFVGIGRELRGLARSDLRQRGAIVIARDT